jgi:hypothetical protein
MAFPRGRGVTLLCLAVTILLLPASAMAVGTDDVYLLENMYTEEGATTQQEVLLNGDQIVQAWFNFTVLEDNMNSDPDSFVFTVRNVDDPSATQSLPGTTDTQGRISVNLPFTRPSSPRWSVVVSCNEAGDVRLGPITLEDDLGNDWSLQVEYKYTTSGNGGNGNGNGGDGDGDGEDGQPTLVTAFQVNMMAVALMALLVVFLAMSRFRGGGELKLPYAFGLIILVDAFFALPIAMLINQQEHGTSLASGSLGPDWLGNLALVLFVLWVLPLIVARKKMMTSPAAHAVLSRVIGEGIASKVTEKGEGLSDDPLSDRTVALLVTLIGLATVGIVGLMLLL